MKLITFIFTIIGLVVTFMIASLFFTRYELLALNQNQQVLYASQTKNIGFDRWLDRTQTALGNTQRTLLELDDLSFLVYPTQQAEVDGLMDDYQDLVNQHTQLLNILELEIEASPNFKKIWEVAFLDNSSGSGVEVTQKLFANLPELISELQKNMHIIEKHKKVIKESKILATSLNHILEQNQSVAKAFMLGGVVSLADNVWLAEDENKPSEDTPSEIVIHQAPKVEDEKPAKAVEPEVITPEVAPTEVMTEEIEDKTPALEASDKKDQVSEKQASEVVESMETQQPASDAIPALKVAPDLEPKPSVNEVDTEVEKEQPATSEVQPAPAIKPDQPTESIEYKKPLVGASLV